MVSGMRALLLHAVASLAGAVLTAPTALAGEPDVCVKDTIEQSLITAGKLTDDDVSGNAGVDQIRCGDVNGDGNVDALFSVFSGGTAGATRFGVIAGTADGAAGPLLTWRRSYKVGLALKSSRSFEAIEPHYGANDPNCCPRSFVITTYNWDGRRFLAGKTHKTKTVPARFTS
jgi:hypothetical protein